MSRLPLPLLVLAATLLAGCGAADAPQPPPAVPAPAPQPDNREAEYRDAAQALTLAFVGRAAEPASLGALAAALRSAGLPVAPAALAERLRSDAEVLALLDAAGLRAEAGLLAQGTAPTGVTALYWNLFGREPDAAELAAWGAALQSNGTSLWRAPLAILAAAAPADQERLRARTARANAVSAGLAKPEWLAAYGTAAGRVAAREIAGSGEAVETALAGLQQGRPVPFATVQAVIERRCVTCHSATPATPGFAAATRGIRFDTAEQILADAQRIDVNVRSEFMPYGNRTRMTQAERALIQAWFDSGAAR